mmetsp:Transcript_352/g.839  ORF Transcript_352/g.839 Transcript_352/m.839 type:complete len:517 (+) Transcript_352:48-1598(+)
MNSPSFRVCFTVVSLSWLSSFVVALPTVSFRLDDVQAWWCEEIVKDVVDEFLAQGVPLNLGLIGNGGSPLSSGGNIGTYLAGWATNPMIEMTSHSHTHVSYAANTLEFQTSDLKDGNDEMELVTGIRPTTFIPPLNEFNADTVTAMISENMDIMSPSCVWDTGGVPLYCPAAANVVAPNIDYNGVDMLPAGAVLGDADYWTDFSRPADSALAIEWIERQIENQGFSVVMLHPVEFATSDACNVLNSKFTQLREVFAYGAGKWDFMTYSNQRNAVKGGTGATDTPTAVPTSSPTGVPSGVPTSAPSNAPTQRAATPAPTPSLTTINPTPAPTPSISTPAPTPSGDPTSCPTPPLSVTTVTSRVGDSSTTVVTVTSETQQIITTTVVTTEVVELAESLSESSSSSSSNVPSALYLTLAVIGGACGLMFMLWVGKTFGMRAANRNNNGDFAVSTEETRGSSLYNEYLEGQENFKKENPLESTADNRSRVRRKSSSSMVAMGALTKSPSTSKYEELGSAI